MSDFIRPWDVNQQVEEVGNPIDNTQPDRSLFDNLSDAISAISANFSDVRGSERLGDLRNELMDSQNLSDDEYNAKRAEYVQEYLNREDARKRYEEAHKNLVKDDSFLQNIDQMGGTIEGMAAQLMGTAGGAAIGALASPFTAGGSIAMGAKIGNAAGAVAGGYLDARSVALQAEEEVLEKGGTWEQAKLAYEEALKKASLTTLPETAVDIIMGNRLMRSALGSKAARNIAGSALGRVGSSVLDPAAKVGTAVSRMTRPIVGRAAGLATDVALQGVTEAGQEVTQDYIANREVAKALGQQDNEYSLGGFKDYALSDQGLETMKTAGIMGAVFGGAGGALSSGQYLQKGSKYTSSNKIHAVTEKMINEGKLSLNKDERQNEEMIISAFKGISPAQLSTWSDADIIAQSAEIRGEYLRNTSHIDETQDITGVRGFVDVINGVGDNQQQKAKTEGELTALSNSALEEYGITPEDRQKFFSTPTENTLLEKAKKELQKQTEQQKQNGEKPQTKIGLTPETAATMNIKGGTIDVKENSTGEGQTANLNMSQSARQSTDGVTSEVKYKDNIGEKWQGFTEYTKDGQELEGKAYKNKDNGKVARITQGNDGAFYVLDTSEGNTQAQRFETLEQAESHLIKNQDNKKVFQGTNQSETQEKRTLEKGEVDVDNGATGQHVGNVRDLFGFIQNNPDAISPEAFMEFVDMSRRLGTEGVDFYFDTKNRGYAKDDNGVYHQVRGWKQRRDESTGRALIQLYRGSDINTAVHEIAHIGYENLSQEDKKTFDTYAVKTMGRFIADLLNVNYDQNFRNRLLNLANDEELQKKINEQPAAFQAEIQLFLNGEVDINNLTEDQQRAIDERWAWEFTFWYMEGYVRGVEPKNIIQRLLNRSCIFLDKELEGIRRVWWHIHHKNSGAESMYRGTNGEAINGDQQIAQQIQESEQTQQTENVAQQPIGQQQYDYGINPEEEQTQVTDSTGYTGEEPFTAQEQNYNTQEEYQNAQEEQQNNNKQNEQEEEPQLNLIMNDETAEAFADEGLKRFGNDIEQLKSALRKRYKATKSREEKKWITKIVKIAELKHFNKWKKQDSNPRLDNVVDVEQNQVGTENIQPTGLQQRNNGYFNANPPQLNPAVVQETAVAPQVEEKFDTNDTIEEENEVEENVVGDAIEEVSENIERIYKTELEPQEIRSIEGDINEVLDGLENETDKTVKKISQSVGKRIEAAKSALRKSNKETDKGQEVYKLCSMSALKDVLDSRLKDGYYPKGNLIQDSVNNVGNLIKTQLGEIQEEWTKPYSEETESAARRDKAEANRIEKERKEAEKLAKKKQKKQAEVASQNLDILEQQIKNQQGEELTDDQLEERADAELVKDNVPKKSKPTTKKVENKKGMTEKEKHELADKWSDEHESFIREWREKYDKKQASKNVASKKTEKQSEVVEGWIDRLSKEEDYDEAMSQLQELLNSNAITEEEYNDISKGLEEHFEGEEDTGSKAEQAQEILNKAFPNKRFQYAWHSTPNNFDKFTLEHLLSGEGFMAHGWGLYFAKKLGINKENYFNKFKMRESLANYDLDYLKRREEDLTHITDTISNVLSDIDKLTIEWDKTWEINEIYLGNKNVGEELIEWFTPGDSNTGNSIFLNEDLHKDQLIKILQRQQIKLLEKLIDVKSKIHNFHPKDSTRILLVDIPEDNVLLRENGRFKQQPKKVQQALVKLVKDNFDKFVHGTTGRYFIGDEQINPEDFEGLWVDDGDEQWIIDFVPDMSHKDFVKYVNGIKETYENRIKNMDEQISTKTDVDGSILDEEDIKHIKDLKYIAQRTVQFADRYLDKIVNGEKFRTEKDENEITQKYIYDKFDEILRIQKDENSNIYRAIQWEMNIEDEECSKLLNKYGIKGISYNGYSDGECAVIFDDTAIDIVSKFKQEEGKWKSEKVDNARNREIDKQKAQRKLEKRKGQKRFQMAQQNEFFVNGENITDKLNDIFFDTDFGYHLFGDNLSKEQAINELKQQLLQMNKDKREYMRFFETSSKEDIDDFGDRWKRKIDGLTESIKDLKEVLDKINKGDLVVRGNQQKHNGSNVIDITNRLKNNNKRFMAGGKFAKNSPIQNQEKLEEYFKQEMKKLGITDKLLKKYGNITDKLLDTSGNTKESKELFEYIKALNKINKKLWKSGNIYRGLDGNWRFWISDNKAKLEFGIQDLFRNFRKQVQNENFYKPEMNLEDIIFHKELFKYYPQLRKKKIVFYSSLGDRTGGYYNPLTDEIGINVSAPMFDDFVDGKDNDFLTMVLLHEVQHAIQEIEGFARGDNERPSFYLSEDKNDVLKFLYGKRDLLYDKASESLMDKREFEPIISYNNEPVLFSDGSSADYVEELPPIFTGAIAKIGGIELSEQESFVLERIEDGIKEGKTVEEILKEAREEVDGLLKQDEKQLNEFNFNEDDEYNEEFDLEDAIGLSNDINTLNVTLQFIDDVSQKVKDGSLQFRKLKDSEVNKFRNKEFNKLNFLRSKKKLEEVLDIARKQDSNGDVVHNNEQLNILQKAIEDSGLVHEFYEISYGESEARDTMDSYKKYKRDVPMQKESKYKELDSVERVPWGEERGGFMKVRRYDKRYMFYARGANNQTVLTEQKEKQFESDFRKTANLAGFTNKFIDDFFSNYKKNDAQLISNEKLNEKNLFNKSFIDFIDNYNKTMVKEHGVKRDLDSRWIGEFSDENSSVKIGMVGERFLKGATSTSEKIIKLGKMFTHNELFKYYPHLKDTNIVFTDNDGMKKYGGDEYTSALHFVDDNGEGKVVVNAQKLLDFSNDDKARQKKLRTTLLHEIQHAIQDYEGLASGAGLSLLDQTKLQKQLLDDYAESLGTTIDNIGDKFVEAFGNKSPYVKKHALDIISGYINNLQNKKNVTDAEQKRIQKYCQKLKNLKTKDEGLYNKFVEPLDQIRNLYWKTLGEIRARQTEERADMTMDERNKRTGLLDEKISNYSFVKNSPITVHNKKGVSNSNDNAKITSNDSNGRNTNVGNDTLGTGAQRVQRSERKSGVSVQDNEGINKGNGRSSSTRRYQKANEKTPLEKAKEQRDARLEQQRKEGVTSDFYKDVYSVSFTESAQQNEENKRKMEYFDKRKEYWDRSEKDGKVTYTRKTPFEHHQKVVTYNGINDVTKEQKKKSKPAQWAEWFKDQLIKYAFNDMHFLAKAARKLGVFDAYTKLVVTKGYALKANTAMERGIKYNGEYTRALNDIIKEVGEEKQHDFIEYCIAKRILDMKELRPEIRQKMSPEEAAELIKKYESGEDAELFKKNQKDFVKYNHALLHVLVDGGVMTEEEFQHHIKNDPNFVPLAKVMDDADFGFNGIQAARSIVNVKSPIKKIGTSMREVKNPFLEMQKRTAEYYSIAARNKAGQIFVNEIAGKIDKLANGDTVARGQGMIRKVKVDEKDGKLITKPDEKQQIIYVCNNGKHEFYQVSDPEIYRALRALDADQMGTLHKMIDPFLHAPSALIRETATMVPDFGIRNLIRDGGEAFMTSEHGFIPFIDQIWGMYQMANNTEWYQRFLEQQGEYGSLNRDDANSGVARVEDTIDEKVNPIKNFNEIRRAAFEKFTNKKNSKAVRAAALLQLMGSMPYAIIKSNKRINDYLEMGTRVGEFKNAKMGYNGTLDRLSKGGILDWGADINNAKQSDILAAGVAKEITLNFGQHGIIGKQLNRYIPFFNATLQGIYKMCNALELMFTGRTLSGEKNHALQGEMLFKAALVTAMAIGVAAAGEGDDDYEEANQYEKENFWILPNGLRFPKDQVLGKLFGNVAEKSYAQWRKGKFEPSDILRSIVENFTPDKFMPAMADITLGGLFNYDTFYKSAIVPEYMQGKLGHLQKDLSTSNMASDISDFLWKYTKTDVSAKRLDWALQKNLTNCKKYIDSLYDLGKQAYDPKSFNEKMARGYDKSDSTGAFVGGLKDDVPKPLSLISGTFATNRTNYKSISDFYEKYNNLKKLATDEPSMSKEEKRQWKRYEQAYKKDKVFRKELRAIKGDSSLTGKQKREKADKIFKQQIKLAKWAEG